MLYFAVSFDFNNGKGSNLKCPKCEGDVVLLPKLAKCKNECGFLIWKNIAGKTLEDDTIASLIQNGKTNKISNFKSKAGKQFDAKLKLNDDFTVEFDFT